MKLTEDTIEQNLIDLLKKQWYTYFNDSIIAPNSDNPQRDAFDSVVLEKQFKINGVRLDWFLFMFMQAKKNRAWS